MNDKRSRNWFLTCNNFDDAELALAIDYPCAYKLLAKEVGEECGTPHLHLYIEHKDAKTFSSIKKKFPRANIQIALGNAEQNKQYLSKQNLILEEGTPKKQGKRTDIETVRDLVAEGANMRSVIPVAKSVQSVRMAEIYLKYLEPKRDWETKIRWFWGPSGTGKSRQAREIFKGRDYYTTMRNGKWWEGYDGHDCVIIDDIREGSYKYEDLLAMTDRYEFRVECKGGSRQLRAKEIIITCPHRPHEVFQFCGEDNNQLIRRIHEIKEFSEINISEEDIEENASSDEEEQQTF